MRDRAALLPATRGAPFTGRLSGPRIARCVQEANMFRRVFAGVEKALNTKNWEKTLERLDRSLRSAAIFSVLEQLGKLSLLFGVASALWTFDRQREEQVRTRQREAWQVILAAEGRRGSGGRHDALETLVRRRHSLGSQRRGSIPGLYQPDWRTDDSRSAFGYTIAGRHADGRDLRSRRSSASRTSRSQDGRGEILHG